MKFQYDILNETEKIVFALRSLYREAGYQQYRMSKFEEYDLYSRNKDFLVSDSVITFTDTNGKLMALRPDVTLSLIKNNKDIPEYTQKLCYNEYVYRIARGTNTFRELMQTGLECFGKIGPEQIREVLLLSAESLNCLGRNFVLDLCSLDITSCLMDRITKERDLRRKLWKCVGEKNLHGLKQLCAANSISEEAAAPLRRLMLLSGSVRDVLPELEILCRAEHITDYFRPLADAVQVFSPAYDGHIRIDFSVTGDVNYYNGLFFKGFLEGIPESVLSGGQYDNLMLKMGRKSHAVGFAVYLDLLERVQVAD